MFVGTIQNQVKMQMLDMKWKQKQQDINSNKNEDMTQEDYMLEHLKKQAAEERKRSATSEIYTKLQSGGTLTDDEIAYLRENNPEALAEYERAQIEKKAYKQALKNCRTKEDVDRLKLNRLGNFAAQAKSIANNPYIPKGKKLELMKKLNNEVCLIRDAYDEFVKSGAYGKLPEESEITEDNAKDDSTDTVTDTTDETQIKDTEDDTSVDETEMSFEQINQDIENYLRKNASSESSFVRKV